MNTILVAKYLVYLRKKHGFTQEELSEKLQVSRQAVSHWECGACVPDVQTLLELSKLYDKTINEILEPEGITGKLESFEELQTLGKREAEVLRASVAVETLIKAYMGTSPENAEWMELQWKDIDFPAEIANICRVRISEVEDAQNEIVSLLNLYMNER